MLHFRRNGENCCIFCGIGSCDKEIHGLQMRWWGHGRENDASRSYLWYGYLATINYKRGNFKLMKRLLKEAKQKGIFLEYQKRFKLISERCHCVSGLPYRCPAILLEGGRLLAFFAHFHICCNCLGIKRGEPWGQERRRCRGWPPWPCQSPNEASDVPKPNRGGLFGRKRHMQ